MAWFEDLFGFAEESPDVVRRHLEVSGNRLESSVNGASWRIGTFEMPTLEDLRRRPATVPEGTLCVRNITGEAGALHEHAKNAGSLFQVASQFNMLEMVSPDVMPEAGVTRYAFDRTQGPACAIAAGAATVWRNYFVPIGEETGQSGTCQIDGLRDLHGALSPDGRRLWQMRNGYALCGVDETAAFQERFAACDEPARDRLRGLLRIGLHWDVEVTQGQSGHLVSQAFSSALPLGGYNPIPATDLWQAFARLVLEATYEAVLLAAATRGTLPVFLTQVGGGVFGNDHRWIRDAIARALDSVANLALDIRIVHFGRIHDLYRTLERG